MRREQDSNLRGRSFEPESPPEPKSGALNHSAATSPGEPRQPWRTTGPRKRGSRGQPSAGPCFPRSPSLAALLLLLVGDL